MRQTKNTEFFYNLSTLIIGNFTGTLISTLGTIIVINFLSTEEYGLINLSFVIPNILIFFGELGLNYASTNFIVRMKKENDINGIKCIIKINLFIKIIFGTILSLLVFFNATNISYGIFKKRDERLPILIQISSFGIFSIILYEAIISILLGLEKVTSIRNSIILRKSIDAVLSIFLLFIGFSIYGPLIGFIIAPFIITIMNMIFLKKEKFFLKNQNKANEYWNIFSKMVKYGYPLSIVSIIIGIQTPIYSILFATFSTIDSLSFYSVSLVSSQIIIILIQSLSSTIFPLFSKYDWNDDVERNNLVHYFNFSIKIGSIIVNPITIILIIFSEDIFPLIYGSKYIDASIFISLNFATYLLVAFGMLSIPAFFSGQKKNKNVLLLELLKLSGGILFSLLFLRFLNGIGIMVGILFGFVLNVIIGNLLIIKIYGKKLLFYLKESTLIFLITTLIGFGFYFIKVLIKTIFMVYSSNLFFIILNFFIISIIYLLSTHVLFSLFSLISEEDLDLLLKNVEKIPVIRKLIKLMINIDKKIIKLRNRG